MAALLDLPRAREAGKHPCPACGSSDALHAFRSPRPGMHCYSCRADSVAVAASVWGIRPIEAAKKLAEAFGLDTQAEAAAPPPRPRPVRLPQREVEEVWNAGGAVDCDAEVSGWLTSRGLDPRTVAARDLARVLPAGDLPHWATCYRMPWSAGWRCILPTYDARGQLAGLRARWTGETAPPGGVKSAAPGGAGLAGLVMADGLGRQLLTAGRLPDWWDAQEAGGPLRIVISEGEHDYLIWATNSSGDDHFDAYSPAVLGIVGGAWTPEIAARIPGRSSVIIRTDDDAAGQKYAEQIAGTIGHRCAVLRGGFARG